MTRYKTHKNKSLNLVAWRLSGCFCQKLSSKFRGAITTGVIAILFFVGTVGHCDPYDTGTFNFRHLLTMEQGILGPGIIRSVAQDRQGFLWFGGDNGLARYDGNKFRMYQYDEEDPLSLGSNRVFSIRIDTSGEMWVITVGGARGELSHFDAEHEHFVRYDKLAIDNELVSVLDIASDRKGNLFLLTSKGLAVFDKTKATLTPMTFSNGDTQELIGDPLSIYIDRLDRIWIRSKNSGLWLSEGTNRALRHWSENGPAGASVESNFINDIYQDSHGNIWVTTSLGVLRISEDLTLQRIFRHDPDNPLSVGSDKLSGICEDKNGRIWISTDKLGVSIYNPATDRFTQLRKNRQDSASLLSDDPQIIFKDRDGDLWIVAYPLGIDYLNMDGFDVARKFNDPDNHQSLSNNGILAIDEDKNGFVWVGTEGGLNRYDKRSQTFKRYLKNEFSKNDEVGLKSDTILSLKEDVDHRFWVGTYGGGLHKFDPVTETFKHYPSIREAGGFAGNNVWNIFIDSNNDAWFSAVSGVARYDRSTDSFIYFGGGGLEEVTAIVEESPGHLLLGSFWGLYRMDVETKTIFRIESNNPYIKSQSINHIAVISNGETWIATGEGILLMNAQGQIFGRLGAEQGLPANFVVGLKQAQNGMVWAATGNGIALIHPDTKQMTVLYQYQGLACDAYRRAAIYEDRDNNMYVGGTNGISIVAHQNLIQPFYSTPVDLVALSVLGQIVKPGGVQSPLARPLTETRQLELSHRQNMFSLEFASLNYKLAGRVEFEYLLEGLTSDWTSAAEHQTATFANLKPGDYQFIVRAHESGLANATNSASVRIRINPPPWMSQPAQIGYGLFALLGIYSLVAARQLRQRKLEAEHSAQAKTEFFATMSHEIRTPLTGVIGMLSFALRDKTIARASADRLQLAESNAQLLLGITNDILDITKIEAGKLKLESIGFDLITLVRHTVGAVRALAERKKINLVMTIAADLPLCVVGDPMRIEQALRKLVENAVKFTDHGTVKISVQPIGQAKRDVLMVQFKVEDTGIGIPPPLMKDLFAKFSQGDVSESRVHGGTGLGLAICKQLVDLMGGNISANSDFGKGSQFEFTLPLKLDVCEIPIAENTHLTHSHQLNILCAEDFVTNQVIIRTLVEEMGHKITLVENGLEAVLALLDHEYDLLLMDGRMPQMDGAQAAAVIRAGFWQSQTITQNKIPIIALTASVGTDENASFLLEGMDDVVTKPIKTEDLARAIDKIINRLLREGRNLKPIDRAARAESLVAASGERTNSDPNIEMANSTLTSAAIAPSTNGANKLGVEAKTISLHEKLIVVFKQTLTERIAELKCAREESDFETLGRVFHGISGSAAHLADSELSAICAALEHAADASNMEFIDSHFAEFNAALAKYVEVSG